MIYIIIFIISMYFAFLSDKNFKIERKRRGILYGIMAIMIPTLLASFRIEGVGTDTMYYVKNNFICAVSSSTFNEFNNLYTLEFLYNLMVFIVSRFTSNIHFLYFAIQLFICGFVYLACYDERKVTPIWSSYGLFLFLYYNRSLNMVRQSIALAIILYAFKYVKNKKMLKYFMLVFIAYLFHKTAIIALVIYPLTRLINNKKSFIFKLTIFVCSIIFIFGYREIMLFLIENHIVPKKYLFYVIGSESTILLIELVKKGLFLIIIFLFSKNLKQKYSFNSVYIYYMILDFLLYLVGFYANYAQRVSYYFGYFDIFLLSQIPLCIKDNLNKKLITIILVIFFIIYFILYYIILGYDSTYPYISFFK